ncbi:hypothetical protein MKX08_003758 [Trichoderma sp. CBMAI-0020]|nr:hypothetical protein MKX08_003758 [Trichoderma sp. CBMAI-0020]
MSPGGPYWQQPYHRETAFGKAAHSTWTPISVQWGVSYQTAEQKRPSDPGVDNETAPLLNILDVFEH